MSHWDDVVDIVLAVARTSYERKVQYPAASFAYYAFVSLLPLLVLLLAVAGEPVAESVRSATFQFLTPKAKQLVSRALRSSSGKVGATLFALVVLTWSGVNVAASVQSIVERVEGQAEQSRLGRLRSGVAILVSVSLGVVSVVLTSALFALKPGASHLVVTGLVVLLVALTVTFLPLYYVPARTVTSVSAAVPGAFTAAFGWTVLLAAVRFYVEHAATYAIYGVLSVIILVLTSLYVAAALLMVGIVVNETLADETGGS